MAQSPTPFVPIDFEIPAGLETSEFRLRMLTINDVVKDFEAVVTSAEHLKQVFPGGTWPDALTLEQDLIDLGWHQKEFQNRNSFAYTVVTPSETRVLGCVYIYPPKNPEPDLCLDRHRYNSDRHIPGQIPLTLGVVGHEGSTLLVVLNSLRLLWYD